MFTSSFRIRGPSVVTTYGEWCVRNFSGEIARILKRQGLLRLLTDDPDYARAMEIHAAHLAEFQPAVDEGREYPPTEFQIKFLADSRPLYGLLLKRVN